jgi:hypothetical protein
MVEGAVVANNHPVELNFFTVIIFLSLRVTFCSGVQPCIASRHAGYHMSGDHLGDSFKCGRRCDWNPFFIHRSTSVLLCIVDSFLD